MHKIAEELRSIAQNDYMIDSSYTATGLTLLSMANELEATAPALGLPPALVSALVRYLNYHTGP